MPDDLPLASGSSPEASGEGGDQQRDLIFNNGSEDLDQGELRDTFKGSKQLKKQLKRLSLLGGLFLADAIAEFDALLFGGKKTDVIRNEMKNLILKHEDKILNHEDTRSLGYFGAVPIDDYHGHENTMATPVIAREQSTTPKIPSRMPSWLQNFVQVLLDSVSANSDRRRSDLGHNGSQTGPLKSVNNYIAKTTPARN